ncbi:hypothetical protein Hanom_Chr12g01120341 [Helianthus anomalus]
MALDRRLSDHCPILLRLVLQDFGHSPFQYFNSWLKIPVFEDYVKILCGSFAFHGREDLALAMKLRWLKNRIEDWITTEKRRS